MFYDVKAYLRGLKDIYREETLSGLDYWAEKGIDWDKRGIVTFLDREGNWYHDEKSGWFTGRSMYSFARGYNDVEKRDLWLKAALCIYDFHVAHQFAPDGRLYYNMSRDGVPKNGELIAGENATKYQASLHSESFAVMGLSELYRATGRDDVKETLIKVFNMQQFIYHNPDYVTTGAKSSGAEQPKVPLAWLMSLLCSTQTIRQALPERSAEFTALIAGYIAEIFKHYYSEELDTIMEAEIDNPGHNMELAWFMLAEGLYTKDKGLVTRCAKYVNDIYEYGWDHEYGGLYNTVNMFKRPANSLNWQIKTWWPQNEIEIGLLYAYIGTGDIAFLEKYRKVHEWVFAHFIDRDFGEWYTAVDRYGIPSIVNKGSHSKGPYHVYRSYYAIMDIIDAYLA